VSSAQSAKRIAVASIAAFLYVGPSQVSATLGDGFLLGSDLVVLAKKDESFALGYIIGAIDAMMPLVKTKGIFCLPANAGSDEVSRRVLNQIRRDTKSQKYQAASTVLGAMATLYPCGKR
jgi:hypothetical protein